MRYPLSCGFAIHSRWTKICTGLPTGLPATIGRELIRRPSRSRLDSEGARLRRWTTGTGSTATALHASGGRLPGGPTTPMPTRHHALVGHGATTRPRMTRRPAAGAATRTDAAATRTSATVPGTRQTGAPRLRTGGRCPPARRRQRVSRSTGIRRLAGPGGTATNRGRSPSSRYGAAGPVAVRRCQRPGPRWTPPPGTGPGGHRAGAVRPRTQSPAVRSRAARCPGTRSPAARCPAIQRAGGVNRPIAVPGRCRVPVPSTRAVQPLRHPLPGRPRRRGGRRRPVIQVTPVSWRGTAVAVVGRPVVPARRPTPTVPAADGATATTSGVASTTTTRRSGYATTSAPAGGPVDRTTPASGRGVPTPPADGPARRTTPADGPGVPTTPANGPGPASAPAGGRGRRSRPGDGTGPPVARSNRPGASSPTRPAPGRVPRPRRGRSVPARHSRPPAGPGSSAAGRTARNRSTVGARSATRPISGTGATTRRAGRPVAAPGRAKDAPQRSATSTPISFRRSIRGHRSSRAGKVPSGRGPGWRQTTPGGWRRRLRHPGHRSPCRARPAPGCCPSNDHGRGTSRRRSVG